VVSPGGKPSSVSGYLDALAFFVISAGREERAVEKTWEGIREAFLGFEPEAVAALTDADVERLVRDRRVGRDRRTIRTVIDLASKVAGLAEGHGGFDRYLRSFGGYEHTVAGLQRDFPFLTDVTAYRFLAMVGENAPDWEEGSASQVGATE
jgi:3-methyladenine DNA glycosylase Tag